MNIAYIKTGYWYKYTIIELKLKFYFYAAFPKALIKSKNIFFNIYFKINYKFLAPLHLITK